MKSLIDVIQEKLKINSKSKVTDDISDWCIIVPMSKLSLLKEFEKEFEDYRFNMSINGVIHKVYVIQSNQLEKRYIDDPDLFIYKIPKNFESIDDFEMTLMRRESPDFDWNELEDWAPEN